jgi:hypothetical protein
VPARLCGLFRAWGIDVVHSRDVYTKIFVAPWARPVGGRGSSSDPHRMAAAPDRLLRDPTRAEAIGAAARAQGPHRITPSRALAPLEALHERLASRGVALRATGA